jgi:spore coat polysaccharide biosynthesis predicted glycosyltransferase SpsG/ribosomal protein S18 acetylase RimI-like enzyme
MRAAIVAEGSDRIGGGHQVRAAALAGALEAAGDEPLLLGRDLPGSTHGWAWAGLPSRLLPADAPTEALLEAAREADVAVLDHYAFEGAALRQLSTHLPVAVVDDVPGRDLVGAALVTNGAPGVVAADYPDVPAATGAAWALLRPEFVEAPPAESPDGPLLVASGANDAAGLLPAILATLTSAGERVVLVGPPPAGSLPAGVESLGRLDAAELVRAMGAARAAVVSASTIALEAAACGLPLVAIRTAANQTRLARGLAALGAEVVEPDALDDLPAAVARALARGALSGVDGCGARRTAERLRDMAAGRDDVLRPACWSDAELLLDWANEPGTRAASLSEAVISRDEHLHWLEQKLADPDARIWLYAPSGKPEGILRLDRSGDAATVSIAVSPACRGRGVGRAILAAGAERAARAAFVHRLDAWVRNDNPASAALFARAGYAVVREAEVRGHAATLFALEMGGRA